MNPPMLAAKKPPLMSNEEWLSHIVSHLPGYVQPKYDGIRCLIREDGIGVSRTLKPIRNQYIITELLKCGFPKGTDGELLTFKKSGTIQHGDIIKASDLYDNFNDVSSKVMSFDGYPAFTYNIFDYWDRKVGYRLEDKDSILCVNEEELTAQITSHLLQGYEGSMFRKYDSPYKHGRVTIKEMYLAAIKPFEDDEAIVVGFKEKFSNQNPKTVNKLGLTERSSHGENQYPEDTLGALVCKSKKFKEEFDIGTGFDEKTRFFIWHNQHNWIGKTIKFKYQASRTHKDKPISPVFLGERDSSDL